MAFPAADGRVVRHFTIVIPDCSRVGLQGLPAAQRAGFRFANGQHTD
jgi:hypothetical protein